MREKKIKSDDLIISLEFLKRTKEGKYSKIDKSSLNYTRLAEIAETYLEEELYYYSVS